MNNNKKTLIIILYLIPISILIFNEKKKNYFLKVLKKEDFLKDSENGDIKKLKE